MKKIDFTQLWHSRCLMALMVMLLALLPGVGWAQDSDNSGSDGEYASVPTLKDGYYEIYTATQLKWFRDLVNGTLTDVTVDPQANGKLMVDIDLQNEVWMPIGKVTEEEQEIIYKGTFDGNYHTISNLNVQGSIARGFFGKIGLGTIKNLGIINAKIESGGTFVGVIAAINGQATIQNCWTAGDIKLVYSDGCQGMAGITVASGGTIINCHTSYSVAVDEFGGSTITNCTAGISSEAYKTGELAYLLNTNKGEEETYSWGQTIGTDAHPRGIDRDQQGVPARDGTRRYDHNAKS